MKRWRLISLFYVLICSLVLMSSFNLAAGSQTSSIPTGAKLVEEISIGGTKYVDEMCSGNSCDESNDESTIVSADVSIYKDGSTVYVSVALDHHIDLNNGSLEFTFSIKDDLGVTLETFTDSVEVETTEWGNVYGSYDNTVHFNVGEVSGLTFYLDSSLTYLCCSDCSSAWNPDYQMTEITCYEWEETTENFHDEASWTNSSNSIYMYIGIGVGAVVLVGGGAFWKKRQNSYY